MIDPERLRAFMHGFYGYAFYEAMYWLIGRAGKPDSPRFSTAPSVFV